MSNRGSNPQRPGLPVWVKLGIVAVLGLVTVAVLPRVVARGGVGPPVALLVGVGALVAVFAGLGMYLAVRRDLRLGVAAALYAVGFNVLIVAVKFVFSPYGVYEFAGRATIESFLSLNEGTDTVITAGLVFMLYFVVYGMVYGIVRRKVTTDAPPRPSAVLLMVVTILVLASIATGVGIVAVVIMMEALDYLFLVFASSLAVFMGLAIAGAIALATLCFRETRERAQVVGDASLLLGMFWLGLAFLALYHVLWVVYILVLTTLWPLKVVTPK